MSDIYKAKPASRNDIREFANWIRERSKSQDKLTFPVVEFFETLVQSEVFDFEILSCDEMGEKYGETFPKENRIAIREDIYNSACKGDAFGKSTMAHELFHLFHHGEDTISLCRTSEELSLRKTYEDPEWQANCFAGELMVPKNLVVGMTVEEVMEKCNVSKTMASYQLD